MHILIWWSERGLVDRIPNKLPDMASAGAWVTLESFSIREVNSY